MANRIPLIVYTLDSNKLKELPVGDNLDLGGAGVTNAGTINATDIKINGVSFNNPFSGDYNDLTNKPTIPTVPTAVSAFANDVGYLSLVGGYRANTDQVNEEVGATNLWHTNSRVDARIQAATFASLSNVDQVSAADDGKVVYYDHSTQRYKHTAVVTEADTLNTVLARGNTSTLDINTTGKVYFANVFPTEGDLPSATTYHGMFAHVHGTGKAYYSHAGNWIPLVNEGAGLTALNVAADDSTIRTISSGESIKFVGGTGISTASDVEGNITFQVGNLGDLVDVGTAGATNGQALVYDLGAGTWGPGTVASSINNLNDLNDVDTATVTPVDNYVLSYKGSTSKWEPRILDDVDAATVTTIADATAASQFVTFVGTSENNNQALRTDASLTYNPNTNVLTATTLSGTTVNTTNLNVSGSISNGVNEVTFATDIKLGASNELRFYDTDNTQFMGFKAPTNVTANTTFTLPDGDGTNGQILVTDGLGTLSWAANIAGEVNEFSFKTIQVSGQTDVVADSDADTLTLVAGANMTITTSGDEITFVAAGGAGGTPGGADTQVQFNDASSFGGDAGLVYNKTTDTLTGVNITSTGTITGATITATGTITADIIETSGTGVPTFTSASNIIFDAASAVIIQQAPLRLGNFDTNAVAGIVPNAGEIIYNSSAKQLHLWDGTSWIVPDNGYTFSVGADDSTLRTISKDESIKFTGGTGIDTTSDTEGNITIASSGPTITYTVTANGSSAYRFAGPGIDGTTDNPNFTLYKGFTYIFINSTGASHPFEIRVSNGGAAFTEGVSGDINGTQTFIQQHDTSDTALVYQCTIHAGMVGNLTIV